MAETTIHRPHKAPRSRRARVKAFHKIHRRGRPFAAKHVFLHPGLDPAKYPPSQTREPAEQDPKRCLGQFHTEGEAPIMGHAPSD